MFKIACSLAALLVSAVAMAHAGAAGDPVRVPILIELFTSEGCSSCPPADHLLEILDQRQPVEGADLIVLSEHVDYWDRLGWKDPFSSAQYTDRQREFAAKLHLDIYTPQMVVDGRFGLVGSDGVAAASAIRKAIREPKIGIVISNVVRDENKITAHLELPAAAKSQGTRGVLYVAIADNRAESRVVRGENAGHLLTHVAVTRVLKQVDEINLGKGASKQVSIPVPQAADGSRLIAFLEDANSGYVLGVAAQRISGASSSPAR